MAVSADGASKLEALREQFGLTFPLVSDPTLEIIARYGVRMRGQEIALPATFVVGEEGTIRFAHVGKHRGDRPSVAEIVAALR